MDKGTKMKLIAENIYPPTDGNVYEYDYEAIINELDDKKIWKELSLWGRQQKSREIFESAVREHTYILTEDESGSKFVNIKTGAGKTTE